MKQKLTKQERSWILYDVGNSAFTLLISTIMPIYFNALAQGAGLSSVDYLAYWGYAASIATLLVAVSGPHSWHRLRRQGQEKAPLPGHHPGRSRGLPVSGAGKAVAGLSGHLRGGQNRLLPEPDSLRLHAHRHYRPGPDGQRVLPGLRLGLHRQLHPFLLCLGLVLGSGCWGSP